MLQKHCKRLKSKFSRAKSFADDLNKEWGIVSSRVALLLRSAEIKPWFSDLSHFFLKYANILACPLNLISSHRLVRALACMSNGLHLSVEIVRCGTSSRFGQGSPLESRCSKCFEFTITEPHQDVVLKIQGGCYAAKYISVCTPIDLKLYRQHNTVMLSNILNGNM